MNGLSPFKQGFLGGLTVLVFVALFFVAATVVAQDGEYDATKDIDKNGAVDVLDVQSVAAAWNSTGSPRAPLVVFATAGDYTGAGPAGYYGRRGMHELCRQEDPAAHFCTVQEIENAMRTTGVSFTSHAAMWVDSAVLGTLSDSFDGNLLAGSDWYGGTTSTDYPLNCAGWTSDSGTHWGYSINTGAIAPAVGACSYAHPVACCK
jgi:hypothetical protein